MTHVTAAEPARGPHAPMPLRAERSGPLKGRVRLPGDKSISHRALLFGALAVGRSEVTGLLEGADVLATARAMQAYGARVERLGPGHWTVDGVGVGGLLEPEDVLDFGNAGTGVRLTMGLAASHPVTSFFTGDASLRRRPMARVIEPLTGFGAEVFSGARGAFLPLAIRGASRPVAVEARMSVPSAQVKSAILLAGLNAKGTTRIHEGVPTRDHTERLLRHFGARLDIGEDGAGGRVIALQGEAELGPARVRVPGDPSSAAFPMVAALIVPGSELLVEGMLMNEGRTGLLATLLEMGADISVRASREEGGEEVADLLVRASRLKGVDVPAARAPSMIDEYPVLAVAAAFAEGTTRMEGLAELKVKESDRLAAVAAGLRAAGVAVATGAESLAVTGAPSVRGGGTVATHLDHRIAMAFLTLGLAAEKGMRVDDGAMIATSFPGFVALMAELGAAISQG